MLLQMLTGSHSLFQHEEEQKTLSVIFSPLSPAEPPRLPYIRRPDGVSRGAREETTNRNAPSAAELRSLCGEEKQRQKEWAGKARPERPAASGWLKRDGWDFDIQSATQLDGLHKKGLVGGDGEPPVDVLGGVRLGVEAQLRKKGGTGGVSLSGDRSARAEVSLRTEAKSVLDKLCFDAEVVGVGVEHAEEGNVQGHRGLVHEGLQHDKADGHLAEVGVAAQLAAVLALLQIVVRVLDRSSDSVEQTEVVGSQTVERDWDGGHG